MKKILSLILAGSMMLGAVPALAAEPYEIIGSFSDEDMTGVIVKTDQGFEDFKLYASYTDGEQVYEVKSMKSSQLLNGREISFDTVEGAEIELFAWNESMQPAKEDFSNFDYSTVMSQLRKANDYWIGQKANVETDSNPWEVSVFHSGNMQAYYMTGDELYRNYSEKWSNAHSWQPYGYPVNSTTNADNICCFRTYLDLYNIDNESANIDYVQDVVDSIVRSSNVSYWDWIDTFYMAGPVFTKMYELTGDVKYLDKMYSMIKYTAENLKCYDKEEGLWFRDASFIRSTGDNGEKVFWSRGDGWVYAAFAQIIEELPDSYEHKDYFVDIFLEMSAALKKAQCENGAWHESLLDPNFNPDCEESGTGFFVYGLLWGINNGYLSESEYFTTAARGWKWLSEVALQDNGHIGYVQRIGAQPTREPLYIENTQHYAYANFVFAASEMAKYLGGLQGDMVPYLKKKLLGNVEVYKNGAEYAIKDGQIVECDINCEEIVVPEGMYLYKHNDLYILSEFITPFNKTETALLDMLSTILDEGKFPERPYTDPDRIQIRGGGGAVEKPDGIRVKISTEDITVSQTPEIYNGAANMIDNSTSTRWSAEVEDKDEPCWAIFDLGEVYELDAIGIAFFEGASRTTEFEVQVSSDGVEYTTFIERGNSSGETSKVEYYDAEGINARYIKLYGYGNSSSHSVTKLWFSPTEVEFYRVPTEADKELLPDLTDFTEFDLNAADVSASFAPQAGNGPSNLYDGNYNSYCALYVEDEAYPEYIEIDLGDVKPIEYVALAFIGFKNRTIYFDIRVSEDGESFETVVPKQGSSDEVEYEQYFKIAKDARYIRVYGYSNTTNKNWISIGEARVFVNEK